MINPQASAGMPKAKYCGVGVLPRDGENAIIAGNRLCVLEIL